MALRRDLDRIYPKHIFDRGRPTRRTDLDHPHPGEKASAHVLSGIPALHWPVATRHLHRRTVGCLQQLRPGPGDTMTLRKKLRELGEITLTAGILLLWWLSGDLPLSDVASECWHGATGYGGKAPSDRK